jgi:hypothetical protein
MAEDDDVGTRWAEVLARANAMLALQGSKITNRLEQADFLMGLGVTRPEAARMLGVAPVTLRALAHHAKKGKGARKARGGRSSGG